MLLQFGMVTFFSWAFPLAPACALVNNLIEMRSDAFKLCHISQRPPAHKAGGIGVWLNVLSLLSMMAVLTNCVHLALTTDSFEALFGGWQLGATGKVLLVFLVEHLVLSLRLVLPELLPSVPGAVKRRLARDNHALARLQGRRSLGQGQA